MNEKNMYFTSCIQKPSQQHFSSTSSMPACVPLYLKTCCPLIKPSASSHSSHAQSIRVMSRSYPAAGHSSISGAEPSGCCPQRASSLSAGNNCSAWHKASVRYEGSGIQNMHPHVVAEGIASSKR